MHTAGKACQRRDSHLSHATAGARGPQPARVTARARARTPPLAPGPRSRHAPAGAAVCWWSGARRSESKRLDSSHVAISDVVFCLKKKKGEGVRRKRGEMEPQ